MSARASKHLIKSDPSLAPLIRKTGHSKLRKRNGEEPFSALARSIAYQQLAGAAAETIWNRVLDLFGGSLPPPTTVARTELRKLRRCGLSRAKALAIKDLARKTVNGVVPSRREAEHLTDEELIERCTRVRGVGPWTVEMFLMFSMGRHDVFPVTDYGVRYGFSLHFRKRDLPTPRELLAYGERWRPYRSHAAWYMWRVVDLHRSAKKGRGPRKSAGAT